MTIEEYVKLAKEELDRMEIYWLENHRAEPDKWPLDLDEEEWGDQELAYRFS